MYKAHSLSSVSLTFEMDWGVIHLLLLFLYFP